MDFKPVFINARDLDDCWFKLLYELNEKGRKYLISEGSYKGAYRLAFDDVAGFIRYPHQRPLAPIVPEGVPAPTNDDDIEKYFIEYLMNGKTEEKEDYKYGVWIVGGDYKIPSIAIGSPGVNYLTCLDEDGFIEVPNQLDWIIKHFKEKGFGNEHCFLTVGYPESNFAYDIPYTNEQERKTSPCLRGLDFRIISKHVFQCKNCGFEYEPFQYERIIKDNIHHTKFNCECIIHGFEEINENYLLTKVMYRSWDLYSGWPVNMGGFTLLNEYIANELGIYPGPLSFTCKSLHAYDFQLEALRQRIGK